MTTKHTPGPWVIRNNYVHDDVVVLGKGGGIIATPKNGREYPHAEAETAEETFANARLIAAAPDLLAALEHLLADARACEMDVGQYSGSLIEARAAIAKATGE